MRSRAVPHVLAVSLALVVLAPASAAAITVDAFGRSYSGQDPCVACHNGLSASDRGAYLTTPHNLGVVDVRATPGALVPPAGSTALWPSPGVGVSGPRFGPSSLYLMMGVHERDFIAIPGTPLPTQSPVATVPQGIGGPADDLTVFVNVSWDTHAGNWHVTGPATGLAYIQMCAGCHNLGVTRPSADTTTLASGAPISPSTPSRITGLSIQCENCHGTGDQTTKHVNITPKVLAWEASATVPSRLLSAEVCGQCHASGSAKERSYSGWGMHSSPNGYTPDETLTAYFTPVTQVPSVASFTASPGSYSFYPNGSNKSMMSGYYNEWLNNKAANTNGHASPVNFVVRMFGDRTCYRCHSGEGFLERIGDPIVPATYDASAATVRWGITCQVCHNTHDPVYGLALRRSTMPTVGVVDCGDCHNWQYEVVGSAVPSATGFLAGSPAWAVYHPQREMNEGRGLIGVAEAGPFMEGVECVDCHMPETSTGMPSHRFQVMLPGDAEDWGVPEGGDSCTSCHDRLSRAVLQARIDGWQSSTRALTAEATATMDAARTRKGWPLNEVAFVATTSADPEVAAYKMAYFDRTFVQADITEGAHNPPYAASGLEYAIGVARSIGGTVSLNAAAATPYDTDVAVFGVVTLGDVSFEPGEAVELQARPVSAGGFITFATVRTNGLGAFSGVYRVMEATEFRAVWHSASGDKTSAVRMVAIGSTGGVRPVSRIAGATRYETAVQASRSAFAADSVPNVVLASGASFPDALAANGLAGTAASPLLLTSRDGVPAEVLGEIARVSPAPAATTVWIVGGTSAVGKSVADQLVAAGYTVQRIGGATRYDTAKLVAERVAAVLGGGFPREAFVVSGRSFADALCVAPVAYASGRPVLLSEATILPPATAQAIAGLGITKAYVVGGAGAIADAVVAALPAGSVRVAAGADRYETSHLFAEWAVGVPFASPGYSAFASGAGYADALAAGATAGANGGVVLLTPPTSLAGGPRAFVSSHRADIGRGVLFGGTAALSNDVRADVYEALNPPSP